MFTAAVNPAETTYQTTVNAAFTTWATQTVGAERLFTIADANAQYDRQTADFAADEAYQHDLADADVDWQSGKATNLKARRIDYWTDKRDAVAAQDPTFSETWEMRQMMADPADAPLDQTYTIAESAAHSIVRTDKSTHGRDYVSTFNAAILPYVNTTATADENYAIAESTAAAARTAAIAQAIADHDTTQSQSLADAIEAIASATPTPWASYDAALADANDAFVDALAPALRDEIIALANAERDYEIATATAERILATASATSTATRRLTVANAERNRDIGESSAELGAAQTLPLEVVATVVANAAGATPNGGETGGTTSGDQSTASTGNVCGCPTGERPAKLPTILFPGDPGYAEALMEREAAVAALGAFTLPGAETGQKASNRPDANQVTASRQPLDLPIARGMGAIPVLFTPLAMREPVGKPLNVVVLVEQADGTLAHNPAQARLLLANMQLLAEQAATSEALLRAHGLANSYPLEIIWAKYGSDPAVRKAIDAALEKRPHMTPYEMALIALDPSRAEEVLRRRPVDLPKVNTPVPHDRDTGKHILLYSPDALHCMGVPHRIIGFFQETWGENTQFSQEFALRAMGMTSDGVFVEPVEFSVPGYEDDPVLGKVLGFAITDICDCNKVWYVLPEVPRTFAAGEITGETLIGWSFYRSSGNVRWQLSGRLQMDYMMMIMAFQGSIGAGVGAISKAPAGAKTEIVLPRRNALDEAPAMYQRFYNQAAREVNEAVAQGKLRLPADPKIHQMELGRRIDELARRYFRQWLAKQGITEDAASILVNRRLYNEDGTEWTLPDIYFPGTGVILDGTIGYKTLSTLQIRRFIAHTGGNVMVVIIRPNQPPKFVYIPTTP